MFVMTDRQIILDLCGGTGSWSKPYQEAGYDVRIITLPEYDVRTYIPPENVYGILAAPPCTEFSLLNCKAEPRKRDEVAGMEIVNACMRIINQCNPHFWALENPRGHLRKYLGVPKLNFQPWFYGDPWTKATDIWGNFNIPKRKFEIGLMFQSWIYTLDRTGINPILHIYIKAHGAKFRSYNFISRKRMQNLEQ